MTHPTNRNLKLRERTSHPKKKTQTTKPPRSTQTTSTYKFPNSDSNLTGGVMVFFVVFGFPFPKEKKKHVQDHQAWTRNWKEPLASFSTFLIPQRSTMSKRNHHHGPPLIRKRGPHEVSGPVFLLYPNQLIWLVLTTPLPCYYPLLSSFGKEKWPS